MGQTALQVYFQGKKAENKQLVQDSGGLALLCMKHCSFPANLRTPVCCCDTEYQTRWKEIEMGITEECPLQARLGD